MSQPDANQSAGAVLSLWRYPVKSMQGEEINSTYVSEHGLLGDRAYALMDVEDGRTVTAKNPKKWPTMFRYRASFAAPPVGPSTIPSVKITTPEGDVLSSESGDLDSKLSENLGRKVTLAAKPPEKPHLDEYWPEGVEGLPFSDHVTDENTLENTFFDLAIIHLLSTSTIDALRAAYPEGRFEARRFRPNIIVDAGAPGFAENSWIGHTIAIGDEVRMEITGPCPRCVMTTLAQGDLPRDIGILKTAVKENEAHVGVYANVVKSGTIKQGDKIVIIS